MCVTHDLCENARVKHVLLLKNYCRATEVNGMLLGKMCPFDRWLPAAACSAWKA